MQMNRESEQFRKVTMAVLTIAAQLRHHHDFVAYGGAALGILLAGLAFFRR
jgi:ABC-type transport system involved in cytochrome bd biosynthesis fused ATPase/permease subunit